MLHLDVLRLHFGANLPQGNHSWINPQGQHCRPAILEPTVLYRFQDREHNQRQAGTADREVEREDVPRLSDDGSLEFIAKGHKQNSRAADGLSLVNRHHCLKDEAVLS